MTEVERPKQDFTKNLEICPQSNRPDMAVMFIARTNGRFRNGQDVFR